MAALGLSVDFAEVVSDLEVIAFDVLAIGKLISGEGEKSKVIGFNIWQRRGYSTQ